MLVIPQFWAAFSLIYGQRQPLGDPQLRLGDAGLHLHVGGAGLVGFAAAAPRWVALPHRPAGVGGRPDRVAVVVLLGRGSTQLLQRLSAWF